MASVLGPEKKGSVCWAGCGAMQARSYYSPRHCDYKGDLYQDRSCRVEAHRRGVFHVEIIASLGGAASQHLTNVTGSTEQGQDRTLTSDRRVSSSREAPAGARERKALHMQGEKPKGFRRATNGFVSKCASCWPMTPGSFTRTKLFMLRALKCDSETP